VGHTYARVKIYSEDSSRSRELELMVDAGSTYTWVREEILNELGIGSKGTRRSMLGDGRTVERVWGEAVVEYDGEKATTVVVFAERGDAQVLGVHALESLMLEVDPVTKRLKKAEYMLFI